MGDVPDVVDALRSLLHESHEAYVRYTTPLGYFQERKGAPLPPPH